MLRTWWQERPPRERAILIGGGVALLLVVFYLILEPRLAERQRLSAEIPQLQEDLAWMQRHLAEAKQLRGQGGPSEARDEGRPFTPAVVEDSLRGSGFGDKVENLRPSGSDGVQVSFKEVPFPDLAGWLQGLEKRSGAKVGKARIERVEEQEGMVNAELTLVKGGGA